MANEELAALGDRILDDLADESEEKPVLRAERADGAVIGIEALRH